MKAGPPAGFHGGREVRTTMVKDGTVLLTGASGFVGSAVARRLREEGFQVRVLVRATSPVAHLADLGLEFVTGDLRNAESVRRAMAGVRHLFHVAADYRLWARNPDELTQTNVAGTRLLMQEAMRAGVARVVYASSVATLAARADGVSADETMPLTEDRAIGVYKRSKVAAERAVEALIAEGLPAVIVNPSTPIGPRDVKPTPTGRIIVEAARGGMPAYVDTGLNLVHVDDVAQGHLAALDRGKIGENYILGGEDVSLQPMLGDIAALSGRRAPRVTLPRAPLFPIAWGAEALARITGKDPLLTADALRMSRYRMFFSSEKARRELGYQARAYRAGLEDALAWFSTHGYLS